MLQKWNTWKIFDAFAASPARRYQLREISRNVHLAPTAVKLHLTELVKQKFVLKEKTGMYFSYRANFDNDDFRFYKKIGNIVRLKESGLIQELERRLTPDAIILFGSYWKGEDTEASDIDLCIIAPEKPLNLQPYEKKLCRQVQLFFAEDVHALPAELQNNILNGITLQGFIRRKT